MKHKLILSSSATEDWKRARESEMIKAIQTSNPVKLMIGLMINLSSLAIGVSQHLI